MGSLALGTKFNSKVYAQKTMKNLIEDRQNTMANIYSKNQANVGVDTADLVTHKNVMTQYKDEHYQCGEDG